MYKVINYIRQKTPLTIRQKIGPILARIWYYGKYLNPLRRTPRVLSIEDTIRKIYDEKLSVIRFGDGEISMIDGISIGFQKRTDELASKLASAIQFQHPNLLICIPGIWGDLSVFKPHAYIFNMHHLYRHGHVWKKLLSYDRIYGDTNMTRPHLAYKDTSQASTAFTLLKRLWKDADVVIVEGSKTRLGVGNDLLSSACTIRRILCPAEHAFMSYDEIRSAVLTHVSKDTLILLSLGPTAKILGLELFQLGYRVMDIGHIDMEYEMFLRNEPLLKKVPHKYFNEINERDPVDCRDRDYLQQIITSIDEK